jgi:hypothetical protein
MGKGNRKLVSSTWPETWMSRAAQAITRARALYQITCQVK